MARSEPQSCREKKIIQPGRPEKVRNKNVFSHEPSPDSSRVLSLKPDLLQLACVALDQTELWAGRLQGISVSLMPQSSSSLWGQAHTHSVLLHRKYQELLKAMQCKDELIGQLEAQLEKQVRADMPHSTIAPCN